MKHQQQNQEKRTNAIATKWNEILASEGLSTNLSKPRTRKRFKADIHLAYVEYLEHPTAQYLMKFSEYRKARQKRSLAKPSNVSTVKAKPTETLKERKKH